jgi:hypothetical protein
MGDTVQWSKNIEKTMYYVVNLPAGMKTGHRAGGW